MTLFREEAIEAKRRRLWGDVRIAHPPSLTLWTVVLTAICAAVLLALIFGRYTRKETVVGFLEARDGLVEVRPIQGGRVARLLVREGQIVAEGDPLIEFTSDLSAISNRPALDLQLAGIEEQMKALEERRTAVEQVFASDAGRLREQISSQQRLRDILVSQRQGRGDALSLAQSDVERILRLQSQGYASNIEADRRRRAVLAEQEAVRSLEADIASADARIDDLRAQIDGAPARKVEMLASLTAESARLGQQRAELQVTRGYVMRAPINGVVLRILARNGQTPANNGPLLSIAPEDSLLQARLLVPTRAIGFLKAGQPANLQVEAFPFQRFGMLRGYIVDIRPLIVKPGELNFPVEHTEPVYEVEVAIPRQVIVAYGEQRPLRPGMALRADLPIDRRQLWQQLFDPLLAADRRNRS
jgi:membrane fusion protein